MIKKLLSIVYTSLLSCFFFASELQAQGEENVWIFGNRAGLNFNTTPPSGLISAMSQSAEAYASICDSSGQLLFYTEGTRVWNKNHTLMFNGNNLHGFPIPANGTSLVETGSTCQGAVIVPIPDNHGKYYIFSLTHLPSSNPGRLYYSIVDMSLNNGLGDVEVASKGTLIDVGFSEKMAAVVGDRCNVWLLVDKRGTFKVNAYEITAAGINTTPVISTVGITTPLGENGTGFIEPAPNRKKVALSESNIAVNGLKGVYLYDFNPATGMLSNEAVLSSEYSGGIAFSANSHYLYAHGVQLPNQVSRFNIVGGPPFSIATIATTSAQGGYKRLKLAPNGKIYIMGYSNIYLDVINYPDSANAAMVHYADTAIKSLLPGTFSIGFPTAIPIFKKDTIHHFFTDTVDCFAEAPTLRPFDTTGWSYKWHDNTSALHQIANYAGLYWVSYYLPSCTFVTDSFRVVYRTGSLPLLQTISSCNNENTGKAWLVFDPTDTLNYSIAWKKYPTTMLDTVLSHSDSLLNVPAGNYSVSISYGTCDTTLLLTISKDMYNAGFQIDSFLCEDHTYTFQNLSTGNLDQWHWDFGDGNTGIQQHPQHSFTLPGNYIITLIANNSKPCYDTFTRQVVVDTLGGVHFYADKNKICLGDVIHFQGTATFGFKNLNWTFDQNTSWNSNDLQTEHRYDLEGDHEVKLNAQFRACSDAAYSKTITVHPLPLVDLGSDSTLCLHGAVITLQNLEAHQNGDRYLWSTGETSQQIQAKHHGKYSLTVTNQHDCANTESVTINKDCYVDIPNAFTPNGDSENDYFFPRTLLKNDVHAFKMKVFNRWGQVIFETQNPDGRGWDGRFNGNAQPLGVYIYLIEVTFKNGKSEQYQGNVTLVR